MHSAPPPPPDCHFLYRAHQADRDISIAIAAFETDKDLGDSKFMLVSTTASLLLSDAFTHAKVSRMLPDRSSAYDL